MRKVNTGYCRLCGNPSEIEVPDELIKKVSYWQKYRYDHFVPLLQNYLPELSSGQRESLITGTHSSCFDGAFENVD